MWRRLGILTRVAVVVLVSLVVVTAAVSGYVIAHDGGHDSTSAVEPTLAPTDTNTDVSAQARAYVDSVLRNDDISPEASWPEQQLSDVLPNHTYSMNGAAAQPLATGIVVGTITSVTASPDPSAQVFVLHIAVEQGLGAAAGQTDFAVGLEIDDEVDSAQTIAGLLTFGRVVVVFDNGTTFPFDTTLPEVRRSGELLGTVDDGGKLYFPYLPTQSSTFVGTLSTVDDLVAASAQPTTTGTISNGVITAR
jgi:hypothetical protein